ncbi:MAG: hypothetical protein Q8J76_15175, partial [Desulfobulbaceae bacterium]|nr:hypothetical protein [Desulfobulbaceae bacterium]
MQKLFVVTAFLLSLLCGIAQASVIDAPHNETFSVSCGSCHKYSLWWQFSPLVAFDTTTYNNKVNSLCLECHDGSDPQISIMQAHSSDILGVKYGPWVTACTDCHDPHRQSQLSWRTSNPTALYLVTGIISSVVPNSPQAGQTTITYSTFSAHSQQWETPNSIDPNVVTWERKNFSLPQTGLTLVHDSSNALNTFSIFSVNSAAQSIVVQGILDPEQINTTQNPTSNTFGLIYGQLIKSHIISTGNGAASHDVKFFDPFINYDSGKIGGFVANLALSRQGICQACHQSTIYWLENGTSDDHYTSIVCTA